MAIQRINYLQTYVLGLAVLLLALGFVSVPKLLGERSEITAAVVTDDNVRVPAPLPEVPANSSVQANSSYAPKVPEVVNS